MLALMLVVGVYFLERLDTRLQAQHRQHLQALAHYLAEDSAEYLSAGNRVSLGVIARQAAELDTVQTLVVSDMQGRELARSGPEPSGSAPVQQAVGASGAAPVGRVSLWPAPEIAARQRVETGFVLVALLLLALRVLAEVIRRRLWPAARAESTDASPEPAGPSSVPEEQAWLRIAVVNLASLRQRYTTSALNGLLAEYQRLLDRVTEIYGGRVHAPLGERARVTFTGADAQEAAFQALCAAHVFLLAAQRPGRTALEFRVLLTTVEDRDEWSLCKAAEAGLVHVPADELEPLALDARALYHPEQARRVDLDEAPVTLQPVEQLTQRYQRLVIAQAEKIAAEDKNTTPGYQAP